MRRNVAFPLILLAFLSPCNGRGETADTTAPSAAQVGSGGFTDFPTCLKRELDTARAGISNESEWQTLSAVVAEPKVAQAIDLLVPEVRQSGTATSVGMGLPDLKSVVAFGILPVRGSDWGRAIALNSGFSAQELSTHYLTQLDSTIRQNPAASSLTTVVIIYAAPTEYNLLSCALVLTDTRTKRIVYASKQLARSPLDKTGIRLDELPKKRSDVKPGLVLVDPGKGYLISSSDVGASSDYRAFLDTLSPSERSILLQTIETDTTPWLVDDASIGMFKVDVDAARRAASEMWEKELLQANNRFNDALKDH
jgi:hypothetical protein